MHMKVNDPAVASMVEQAVGSVDLLGFIAQNETEGREMRAEMQRRGWQVDVDTMTNAALDRPIVPLSYLEQFRDIGIKGYGHVGAHRCFDKADRRKSLQSTLSIPIQFPNVSTFCP